MIAAVVLAARRLSSLQSCAKLSAHCRLGPTKNYIFQNSDSTVIPNSGSGFPLLFLPFLLFFSKQFQMVLLQGAISSLGSLARGHAVGVNAAVWPCEPTLGVSRGGRLSPAQDAHCWAGAAVSWSEAVRHAGPERAIE